MSIIRDVAIVGGGFSGSLLAINLMRHNGPRATIVERGPAVGPGLAYSTPSPDHLLNIRAANMSALPDDPNHFVRWLAAHGAGQDDQFVPRALYGRYLTELLEQARDNAPDRLRVVRAAVTEIDQRDTVRIRLDNGDRIDADTAVLALGNLPPAVPAGLAPALADSPFYVSDPWAETLGDGLRDSDDILILGTGLTMVDVALLLDARGFRGRITALSRRGLAPRQHAPGPPVETGLRERAAIEASPLLRSVRTRSEEADWRTAIDELRPYTQHMWLSASMEQRKRFLRHLRPWWDSHRHRMAPSVAQRIDTLRNQGRLRVLAGQTLSVAPSSEGVEVAWRPRKTQRVETLRARLIINCTGPRSDLSAASDPLVVQLFRSGQITADPLGLGLVVDQQSRVRGADGQPRSRLFAVGPMTKGTFWEITAVPDIRVQAWRLARYLANAHWIDGEGL